MAKISVTDIVFVSFPFSNLSHSKLRPALVLAYAQRGDWVLCQITSKDYGDNKAIRIDEQDYVKGNLNITSFVRPNKLFTANESIIVKNVSSLKIETHNKITKVIQNMLDKGF